MTEAHPTAPLASYRVVDLTADLGAMGGRVLADLGADVVLVEPPGGSPARADEPTLDGLSLEFAYRHANKASVVLDLDDAGDRDRLHELLATADVVIDGARPGARDGQGLGPHALAVRHPHLVVAAVTPFGLIGPYRDWVVTDASLNAVSGMVFKAGTPDREPLLPPATMAYDIAGVHAAFAVLAALWQRHEDGGWGQVLDISANESVAQVTDWSFSNASAQINQGITPGEQRVGAGPIYTIYKCADGYVRLIILSPRQWHAMRAWLGEPDYLQDPELDSFVGRFGIAETVINPLIEELFSDKRMEDVAAEAQQRGIVCTPVLGPDEVLANEHFASRGTFVTAELVPGHPGPVASGFYEFDGRRMGWRQPVGEPGADTDRVLGALGPGRPTPAGEAPAPHLPLAGLAVADFGHGGVGVEVGRMLVEYGADVVKIESRAYPDFIRSVTGTEMSPSFASSSRSKQSLGVNAKAPEGHDLLVAFASDCDVVIENNSTGTMDSLGLGYATLAERNPGVVMISSQLLGSRGAWADWIGYGPNTQPVAGLIALWNYADADGPAGNTSIFPDHFVGRLGAVAALAAVLGRLESGRGSHVEIAQVEASIGIIGDLLYRAGVAPGSVRPRGNRNPKGAPWGLYPADGDDRWVAITVTDDDQWAGLVRAMGSPEWAADPALATAQGRFATQDDLDALVGEWTSGLDRYEITRRLQAEGVPAAPMLTGSDQLVDEHFLARGYKVRIDQPAYGPIDLEGPGFRGERMTDPVIAPAPALGEHTEALAADRLGLSPERIAELLDAGVLEVTPPHEPTT